MNILLTGGAGYIGSHICVKLFEYGYTPIVIDNFINSSPKIFQNVNEITDKEVKLYKGDVRDRDLLDKVFSENEIYAVIHLAGFKCVGESVQMPYMYYHTNIVSTLSLLEIMEKHNCYNLIFSSSCTVYGNPKGVPVKEDAECNQTSPYGRTKYFQEQILMDMCASNSKWNVISLRYFNPIGSHRSGLIGDLPSGKPNTLMPYLTGVVTGKYECLSVFGNNYNTEDGTCVRDYIHIEDLADIHIKSISNLHSGYKYYNIGTGKGTSVLELIDTFEKATGEKVNYKFTDRRNGDVEIVYCDSSLAMKEFNWKPTHTLSDACITALKFARYVNKL